ncbi:MAG: CDP-alcohol phosphatidyltransferase family protein [Vicinamibacterales bacterium]
MTQTFRPITARRELATRHARWARALARRLAAAGVRPNAISVAGVGFALAAAAAFFLSAAGLATSGGAAMLVAAAACIQLRLLCNLLDGMVAVEEGRQTRTGEIFNDLPDRIGDVLILAGAGYASPQSGHAVTLGWAAAMMALLTAYVRVLGGSLGLRPPFIGPMAKQHRMFVLTVVTLLAACETAAGTRALAIPTGLAVIVLGSIVTVGRRTRRLLDEAVADPGRL